MVLDVISQTMTNVRLMSEAKCSLMRLTPRKANPGLGHLQTSVARGHNPHPSPCPVAQGLQVLDARGDTAGDYLYIV